MWSLKPSQLVLSQPLAPVVGYLVAAEGQHGEGHVRCGWLYLTSVAAAVTRPRKHRIEHAVGGIALGNQQDVGGGAAATGRRPPSALSQSGQMIGFSEAGVEAAVG